MAKKVVTTDDLDPKQEAGETITYGIDGRYREIDLSEANAKKFRDALTPFNKVSRIIDPKVGARRFANGGDGQMGFAYGDYDSQAVRTWAQERGIAVNDKGRVPDEVVKQYFQEQATVSSNGTAASHG